MKSFILSPTLLLCSPTLFAGKKDADVFSQHHFDNWSSPRICCSTRLWEVPQFPFISTLSLISSPVWSFGSHQSVVACILQKLKERIVLFFLCFVCWLVLSITERPLLLLCLYNWNGHAVDSWHCWWVAVCSLWPRQKRVLYLMITSALFQFLY